MSVATSTWTSPRLEAVQRLVRAGPAILSPCSASRWRPSPAQLRASRSAPMLGAREDQHLAQSRVRQQLAQQLALALLGHAVEPRATRSARRVARADLHRHRVCRSSLARLAISSGRWPRTAASAASAGSGAKDAADVGQEAHVQHAVGLVQHQDLDPIEHDVLALRCGRAGGPAWRPGRRRRLAAAASAVHVDAAEDQPRCERRCLAVGADALARPGRPARAWAPAPARAPGAAPARRCCASRAQRAAAAGARRRRSCRCRSARAPITSRPASTTGMACAWIGVGSRNQIAHRLKQRCNEAELIEGRTHAGRELYSVPP